MTGNTLQGFGQTATDKIDLPKGIYRAHFTHTGQRNFIVQVFQNEKETILINRIGSYDGARPLTGGAPLILDIQADGNWTVNIQPIGRQTAAAFSGQGDDVSDLFSSPGVGPWEIKHTGQYNFMVELHCNNGTELVQNEIGPVDGSKMISCPGDVCLWEVQAEGEWSLKPR